MRRRHRLTFMIRSADGSVWERDKQLSPSPVPSWFPSPGVPLPSPTEGWVGISWVPTSVGQDVLLVQEELVAIAVLQLWLHDEVDELAVIRGGGVGHVGIIQLPIWGGSDHGEKGSLSWGGGFAHC